MPRMVLLDAEKVCTPTADAVTAPRCAKNAVIALAAVTLASMMLSERANALAALSDVIAPSTCRMRSNA